MTTSKNNNKNMKKEDVKNLFTGAVGILVKDFVEYELGINHDNWSADYDDYCTMQRSLQDAGILVSDGSLERIMTLDKVLAMVDNPDISDDDLDHYIRIAAWGYANYVILGRKENDLKEEA